MDVIGKLGGKKFLIALISFVLQSIFAVLGPQLGLTPEDIVEILRTLLGTTGAYLVGQSVADGWSGGKTSHVVRANQRIAAKYAAKAAKKK